MRNCNATGARLLAAIAAAMLFVEMPLPAYATTEGGPAKDSAAAGEVSAQPATPATVPAEAAAAPTPPKPKPSTLFARINLTTQTMIVQEGSKTVHSWKVSTGAPGYATPPGTFKPGWMAKMWNSRQYDDAPMPFSVFFNGGIAVHGTMAPSSIGRAASHGCVRLHTANAERFYKLVAKHGMGQTRIVVHGAQPFSRHETIAARNKGSRRTVTSAMGNEWVYAPSSTSRATARSGRTDSYGYAPQQQRRTAWARY